MSTATAELLEIELLLSGEPQCEDDHIWDDVDTGHHAVESVPACATKASFRLIETCRLPAELICEPLAMWLLGQGGKDDATVCSKHWLEEHVRIEAL